MRYCPNCQTRYTDDTLKFCLQDGTPLADEPDVTPPTVAFGETETVAAPRRVEPLRIDVPPPDERGWQPSQETQIAPPVQTAAPPKKSRTFLVVLATAFITLLLLAVGGIGAWLYLRNNRNQVAVNSRGNANDQISAANANAKANQKISPTPTASPKDEANSANANSAFPAIRPTPAADPQQVREEVAARVDAWTALSESKNLNAYMNYYADKIDYYNKKNVSADYVRNDKQRAFSQYDSIEMNVSNLTVTPEPGGERATAVFDKEWVFEGDERYSAGKVKTQLQMKKTNGQWLIVSERDLKVYYVE